MKRLAVIIIAVSLLLSGCGFLRNARVCEQYLDHMIPREEPQLMLITWPFHLVMLAGCAVIDQAITTFEIIPSCGVDSWDYLILHGNGNNILFERSILIPKTLATPVIFIGSYIVRWFVPVELDERPFQMDEPLVIPELEPPGE
jgi:hypothetical protein